MRLPRRTIVVGGVALGSLLMAGYFAWKAHTVREVRPESEEINELLQTIGSIAYLPEGEVPTLATVTNTDKLDNQPFFRNAKNGDKILIYPRAGWAVLYRPSSRKVLGMTEVDIEKFKEVTETTSSDGSNTEITTPVTVMLYNGSTKVGTLNEVGRIIGDRFPKVSILGRQQARRQDYTETMVVDLSGSNSDLARLVAQALGGVVVPHTVEGEDIPTADIMVIVGTPLE